MPHVLIATDADSIVAEITAALGGADTSFEVVRAGQAVGPAVQSRTPDLAFLDLQIGNMGGMAACMHLRLEESAGRLPHVRIVMLLDRAADVFLAQRCGAEGWLVKPLDAVRLSRAAQRVLAGEQVTEGVPEPVAASVGAAASSEPGDAQ